MGAASVDELHIWAVALLERSGVLLPCARLQGCPSLAVVAGVELVTIRQQKQSLARDGYRFGLIGGLKDQHVLGDRAFAAGAWLAGQHGSGDAVAPVGAGEGGDSHCRLTG